MAGFSDWVGAARPRTLPLALAGVGMANLYAATQLQFTPALAVATLLTALILQVLSNFANDYGDFVNGADNDKRIGPKRSVQSGAITAPTMKQAMWLLGVLALMSGLVALYLARHHINFWYLTIVLLVGIAAIWAAINYTAGNKPYGYKGLGDIAVFVFFGLTAVMGTYYLQTGMLNFNGFLLASAFGCLSTGVLNLNNMRDIENDQSQGKITLPVKWGLAKAKRYHYLLITSALLFFVIFGFRVFESTWQFLFLTPIALHLIHIIKVRRINQHAHFNPLLKELSLKSALLAITVGLSTII